MPLTSYEIPVFFLEIGQTTIHPSLHFSVLEKLSEYQNELTYTRGRARIAGYSGRNPFGQENLGNFSRQMLTDAPLSVALCSGSLDEATLNHNSGKSWFIALEPVLKYTDVPIDLYSVFSIAVVTFRHFVPNLPQLAHDASCPFSPHQTVDMLRDRMSRGSYCSACGSLVRQSVQQGTLDSHVVSGVSLILDKVAGELKKRVGIEPSSHASREEVESKIGRDKGSRPETIVVRNDDDYVIITNPIALKLHADTSATEDLLRYQVFIDVLSEIIVSPDTETPLVIGLSAPWGRGKTFTIDRIKKELRDTIAKGQIGLIEFNAWKYRKSRSIWLQLFQQIVLSLKTQTRIGPRLSFTGFYFRRIFSKVRNWMFVILATAMLWLAITWFMAYIHIENSSDVSLSTVERSKSRESDPLKDDLNFWIVLASLVLSILGRFLPSLMKVLWVNFDLSVSKEKIEMDEYGASNVEMLKDWICRLKPKRNLIIIDDLDRCSPQEILDVLETIQLFLKVDNCLFLVAADNLIIRHAVSTKFHFMPVDPSPNSREKLGVSFLEKIIDIPFHIPRANQETIFSYHEQLIRKHLPTEVLELQPSREEHGDLKTVSFKSVPKPNPAQAPDMSKESIQDRNHTKSPFTEGDLTEEERTILSQVMVLDEVYWSPRLTKRLINVYFIARELFLRSNVLIFKPNRLSSFIPWLAMNLQYPLATKHIHEWLSSRVYSGRRTNGYDVWSELLELTNDQLLEIQEFNGADVLDIRKVLNVCRVMQIQTSVLEETRQIYSCFNMTLD